MICRQRIGRLFTRQSSNRTAHRFVRLLDLLVCCTTNSLLNHPSCRAMTTTTTTTATSTRDNNNGNSNNNNFKSTRLVYGKDDALFGAVEQLQGEVPFGRVLDAGTGLHSLRWIGTLGNAGMTHFTAVTADSAMRLRVQSEADLLGISEMGNVVLGNWFVSDENGSRSIERALENEQESYDTILADYLIGAMDGFSPYYQDQMIPKLCRYLKPGGNLYIVGLEPIPDAVEPKTALGNIVCKVRQVRDACILLAGHRCYREYPLQWIQRHIESLEKEYGIKLAESRMFPILYRHETIVKQINVGRSKLSLFSSPALAESMKTVLDDLERQSKEATERSSTGKIQLGFDYLVRVTKQTTR